MVPAGSSTNGFYNSCASRALVGSSFPDRPPPCLHPRLFHRRPPRCHGRSDARLDSCERLLTKLCREIITIQAGQCGNSSESHARHGLQVPTWAIRSLTAGTSWEPVLAAALPGTRNQPGWKPRGLCHRGRRPQGRLLLPERRHAIHSARHPHRSGAEGAPRFPSDAVCKY